MHLKYCWWSSSYICKNMMDEDTYAPFGLNIEDSVWPIPSRCLYVTGGLTFLGFFCILVRPETEIGQDFSDMAFIYFLYFWYCLFHYY